MKDMLSTVDKQLKIVLAVGTIIGSIVGTTFAFTTVFVTKTYLKEVIETHEKLEDAKIKAIASQISGDVKDALIAFMQSPKGRFRENAYPDAD